MKSLHIRRMFAKLQAVMEKTLNVLRNFHKTGRDGARPSRRRRIQPVFDNGGTTSVSSAEVLQEATLPVFWPSAFSLNPFSLGVPKGRHGRRGIALLVVIGLTAMMMLLGAAFIIYMRTERLASGNFKSDVRARQLLHVALASAMDNVEKSFVDAANPPYPPFDVLYSPIVSGGTNVVAPLSSWDLTNTCWGATNYLPRGAFVTQSWDIVNGSSAKNPSKVGWQTIKDVGGVSGEDVRYAYVVLNVSGLFDANQVGLNEGRGAGTDVQEIDLRNLPDAANVTNGFDTLPTLFAATGATNNFVVFQPYLRTNQSPLIRLDGSVGELEARNGDIIGELKKCGINNDTESVFKSLLDYVGTEVKPRDFTIPCMKKVPMLNEAKLSVAYWYDDWSVAGQTSLVCSVQAMVESWYPYATKREDGKKFKITADVQTTLKEGASVLSSSPIKIFSELAGFDPGANSFPDSPVAARDAYGGDFHHPRHGRRRRGRRPRPGDVPGRAG